MIKSVLIVIPAYNEFAVLRETIATVLTVCRAQLGAYRWRVVIAENGSTDATPVLARELATAHTEVSTVSSVSAGKGAAVLTTWASAPEDILVFMDADLSADLNALSPLIAALQTRNGLAIGSRLILGAHVTRGFTRELGSRLYCYLARTLLRVPVTDWQCGFKSMTHEAAQKILPAMKSKSWFFDTELIALCSRRGIPIVEVPVTWIEARVAGRASKLPAGRMFVRFVRELIALRRRLNKGDMTLH